MTKPKVEWDASWDDDWQTFLGKLEDEIESEHPREPREAVRFYRMGFSAGRRHPTHDWADVETDMYQDYMGGAPEPGETEPDVEWEEASVWAHQGWLAGHPRER